MSKEAWGGDDKKKKKKRMGAGKKTKVEPAGPDAVAEAKDDKSKKKEKPTIGPNAAKRGSIVFCGCTDFICCIIFLVFLCGMLALAAFAMINGDVQRLFYGSDYEGNVCGSGTMEGRDYIYYPLEAQNVQALLTATDPADVDLFGICVESCPAQEDISNSNEMEYCSCLGMGDSSYDQGFSLDSFAALMDSCPDDDELPSVDRCACTNEAYDGNDESVIQQCWPKVHKTIPILFRCVPWGDYDVTETVECANENNEIVYWDYTGCEGVPYSYPEREDAGYDANCGTDCGVNSPNMTACSDPVVLQNPDNDLCINKVTTSTTVTTGPTVELPLMDQLQGGVMTLSRYFGDLATTSTIWVAMGAGGACVLGFIWLVLLKFFAGVMVWTSLLLVFVVLLIGTGVSAVKAGYFTVEEALTFACDNANEYGETNCTVDDALLITDDFLAEGEDTEQWKTFFYVIAAVTVLFLCIIIALFNKIRLAINVIKEASKALRDMPLLVLFPFIPMVIMIIVFVLWILIALGLASSGDFSIDDITNLAEDYANAAISGDTPNATEILEAMELDCTITDDGGCGGGVELNPLTMSEGARAALFYHLFGLLWIGNFVGGVTILIIAGAGLQWYWVKTDEKGKRKLPKAPLMKSTYYALRHHMGTAAFGGCIIAICQMVRIILAYIDKKTQKAQEGNKALKIFMKVIQICMACFEKVLKFISRNAYIMCALTGKSFCGSTKDAFLLILANMGRIAAVNIVSTIILFLGKVFVTVFSCIITYNLIMSMYNTSGWESENDDKEMVNNAFFPTFFAGILAYFIANVFFYVYDIIIDSLIISFCYDCKMNAEKENKEYYMPESLRKFVQSKGKDDEKGDE